ncbi:MAG: DMT family transporter [Proteobacteria bacterium]|nr:DMT family transporter [Pseudomonadota bacterium]MBS0572656.1 DMT family transporter [Pseudomonadota bacterium]
MTQPVLVSAALIALGGAAIAVQAPLNAALSRSLGSPLAAAAVSFAVGLVALAALALATGGSAPVARLAGVPLWQLVGGFLGAFYVWSVISGVASLGVVTAVAALILGQLVAALLLDQFGAFGLAVQPVTLKRLVAVALVAGGLMLSRG